MATKQRRVSLGFAGPGETSLDNAKALLNDFLGFGPEDDDGFPAIPGDDELDLQIYLPATDEHLTSGMETVIEWLDYADLAYDAITDKSTEASRLLRRVLKNAEQSNAERNVNQALVEALAEDQKNGIETYLVLLWGEEGDENSEILLDLASSYEVRAMDLTQGLDDLDFGDQATPREPEPQAAPEPEPEPERPARRRRTTKATTTATKPEPQQDAGSLESEISQARRAQKQQPEPEPWTASDISADLRHRFEHHPATERTAPLHARVREVAVLAAGALDYLLIGESREKSLAMTKIEEAMFWANAHIARNVEASAAQAPQEPQKPATRRRATKAAAPATKPAPEPEKAAGSQRRGRGRPRKDGTPAQPRSPEERAVTEIWDEDEQNWVPAGRGRIPKGIPTRRIDPKTGEIVAENSDSE